MIRNRASGALTNAERFLGDKQRIQSGELIRDIVAIGDVLKRGTPPFDYLTPSWHIEDGTDDCSVGISARWGEKHHSLMIYTHYLDAPPELKWMYPPGCCAVGTLQSPRRNLFYQKRWKFAGLPSGGWSITTTNVYRRQLPM